VANIRRPTLKVTRSGRYSTTPTEQQGNFRNAANVTARPEVAPLTGNSPQFQPSAANILGDMHDQPPALNGQTIPVVASGDMVSGGFESHVDRTPRIVALPDNA